MKPLLLAPMLIILASHQAGAQSPQDESKRGYLGVQRSLEPPSQTDRPRSPVSSRAI